MVLWSMVMANGTPSSSVRQYRLPMEMAVVSNFTETASLVNDL